MSAADTIKRYPRLAVALLTAAADVDTAWAAGVINSVRNKHTPFSVGLVREAWRKRHALRSKEALRAVEMLIGNVGQIQTLNPPQEELGMA